MRAYLLAFLLLGLGLAGAFVVASEATRPAPAPKAAPDAMATAQGPSADAMRPAPRTRPRPRPIAPDAAVVRPRPRVTPDAAVPKTPDAATPRPRATPDAAAPRAVAAGPPRVAGPEPALVVQFNERSSRINRKVKRAIRRLVRKHGYKDVRYRITGYAAERTRPKQNRYLAKKRCRRIKRQIRKRGVSRRWIECTDPVYRKEKRKATDADLEPAWRRVEVRVVKP